MKKIVIEQLGNLLLVGLFGASLAQSLLISQPLSDDYLFILNFGWLTPLFLGWGILFSIIRGMMGIKLKKIGYSPRKGEFSAQDEREELLSAKATRISYYSFIIMIIGSMAVYYVWRTLPIELPAIQLILPIILLTLTGLVAIASYLVTWLVADLRN